jgi:hypothetical protein
MNKYNILEEIKYYVYRKKRESWLKGDIKSKLPNASSLDSVIKEQIVQYWKSKIPNANKFVDFRWFDIYNTIEKDKSILKYYIPDNFYYCYIDTFLSHPRDAKLIDDKNLYDLFFYDIRRPRTIVRVLGGVILDGLYNIISKEQAYQLCLKEREVILKKTTWSEGGKGISFWNRNMTKDELTQYLCSGDVVVQEVIKQHKGVAQIHPSSINTIRILTLYYKGEIFVLSSVFRMGVNSARVDNASSGGIVSGIMCNGQLKDYAYDTRGNRYSTHPQGMRFADVVIPNYDECVCMVKKLAPRFLSVSRLISWDLAIAEDGHPLLIEANLSFGEIDFHQMNNGPIFGDMTDEILEYVINNNKFIKK